ncbi:ABC-F family ATP-binding cassette domain-containing protein [Hyphobacterium marinum]|uniref:ABC-F family ATP-binding cassette domain-containing protein n=1 Tax=Hyphobacterium marinum TaxID=3116574 RepID=A0ABU7M059_9PROT|nr:ABC-F family ATP-binding cassette domain-containing protein [Hyphobacterium sp. Y6023]MEE2567199.1 ABC-F family ATP-binding cassette domain-containing protein [Hyphobacterium sp. Y6023]
MLHVNDLTFRMEGRLLIDQATFHLPAKSKMGLVGRNGSGKSTLFRIIKGELSGETGSARIRKGARVGTVDQEAPGGPESLMAVVLAGDSERHALMAEAETATDPARIAEIQTRLADIEAHSAEARAGAILSGLGFTAEEQRRPCSEFSGGWRMRVALAATLFARPDLLLLDEPTNYLDLEGAVWLEGYLKSFPGAALVISHDRDLLNGAMDRIAHLKQGKIAVFEGGYDSFEKQLSEKQRLQMKLKAKQDEERRHLQAFVDRFKAKASKARQAQSRVKRLEKMQPVATIIDDPVAPFTFPDPQKRMAPPIIRMEGTEAGYEPGKPVLRDLDLRIDPDDRIGILGRNGEGKSTLAKLISGRLDPMDGHLRKHKKLDIAYFAQHQMDALPPEVSAYQHVVDRMPDATEAQRRSRLATFGLPHHLQESPAKQLSGGEKARLLMHLIAFDGPHLILLDEPTNHLDMDSRAALIDAINAYEGAVIVISHDRHLIESCVDRLWLCAGGTVAPYDGDMEEYRAQFTGRPSRDKPKTAGQDARAEVRKDKAERRKARQPLLDAVRKWEAEAERLRGVLAVIDKGLAAPGLYEKDPKTATELQIKRAKAVELIDAAETKWLEAEEALEEARRG